jgi:2-hydroxy-3-keto-5-methylthiopentenyl-1-phosphate phosphatase
LNSPAPRAKLFFDPAKTRAGLVTCGGLCPGLNNVIRALFFALQQDNRRGSSSPLAESMSILISDFDGTVTQYDFFDRVRKRWPFPPQDDPWEKFVAGEITHFQALAEIFARIRTTEADLRKLADSMELDASFARSARALQERGWEIVIASAGCHWYIDFLLNKAGVSVSVHANPGVFDPERGLLMSLPERSPFFSPTKGVNKTAIVQDALKRSDRVAFAGDGRPDFRPALLVRPQLRFARGWLAEALSERGEKFHLFECWSKIADQLQKAEC